MAFYLTLPSNASKSLQLYPQNTMAEYTTQLFEPITLEGRWEVALVETIFSNTFYNVVYSQYYIEIYDKNPMAVKAYDQLGGGQTYSYARFELPPGHYSKIDYVLNFFNKIPDVTRKLELTFDEHTGHVEAARFNNDNGELRISPALRDMLGFGEDQQIDGIALNPVNLTSAVPTHLYFYSDVVEHQLVGDTSSPLLRIVGIRDNVNFGATLVNIYDSPHYAPVGKNNFNTISIAIKTTTGDPAPFTYGASTVKLHFRQQQKN